MSTMQYLAIAATLYCIVSLLAHFVKIVRLGAPKDKSEPSGSVKEGVIYANTRAMMPTEKESAYLHLPSYAVGMLFHIGLFCSLLFFVLSFFPFFNRWISNGCNWHLILAIPPAVATVCGLILFFRRLISNDLKVLSMPDDFISTGLVTLFLLMTTLYLSLSACCESITILYYISSILLLLYLPLGKLRHVVYYFAARYHLGFFYGWRNVWPNHEKK